MVEQVKTGDALPHPPPPDPPSQRGPEASKELRAAYKGMETPGLQPTKEFQADLNQHQSDRLSREARTLPDEYYREGTTKETPASASRSPVDASRAPGTPPTQPNPEQPAPDDTAKPAHVRSYAESPKDAGTAAVGENPDRPTPTEVPRTETPLVPGSKGPDISPQMAAALSDRGSAPFNQVSASPDQFSASPDRGSPSASGPETPSGPATNERTTEVPTPGTTETHDAPPTTDVPKTPHTPGQADEVKPATPDTHVEPPRPTDTPVQPQTKDIVFVGGDPLMRSELIDHLGSHGFGKDDSVQFDPDRLHQSHDMDPTDMAERMKAGDLTVIDLGASPTQDTLENISANSDRQVLGVPQLNEHGTQAPGSGSFARQDSPEDANPSYLPVYETMGNTDSAVVTGQTMDRVRQHADETGAGTYEPPQTHDPHAQYAMNMAWMGDVMVNNPRESGNPSTSAVADLGANPLSTTGPSNFAAAEDRVGSNLGVRRHEIPPEVNGASIHSQGL